MKHCYQATLFNDGLESEANTSSTVITEMIMSIVTHMEQYVDI